MCISMYYMSLRYHGNGFVAKKWKKICLRAYTSAGSSEPMSLRPINSRLVGSDDPADVLARDRPSIQARGFYAFRRLAKLWVHAQAFMHMMNIFLGDGSPSTARSSFGSYTAHLNNAAHELGWHCLSRTFDA